MNAWDIGVPAAVRALARKAAKADGGTVTTYVQGLILADASRRGFALPTVKGPSAATRVRDYVRDHGPIGGGAAADALGLKRAIVDAILCRAVQAGQLERCGEGVYRGRGAGGR